MERNAYILSEAYTANLVETLLQEIKDLQEMVRKLTPQDATQLVTEREAANRLCISYRTLITLRTENKITYRLIGASVRYSTEDIREFEERCKRTIAETSNPSNSSNE